MRPARPHDHREPRVPIRRHGPAGIFDQHDRSRMGLPQPGMPIRRASPPHQNQPRRDRPTAGPKGIEATEELHARTSPAADERRHPRRSASGHVAHGSHVRPSAGRTRRTAMAIRRARVGRAVATRRRTSARSRQEVRRPGLTEDRTRPPDHRPPSAARRSTAPSTAMNSRCSASTSLMGSCSARGTARRCRTRTTQGYRHAVTPSLPHAIDAWDMNDDLLTEW